jgi:hypothetical protein
VPTIQHAACRRNLRMQRPIAKKRKEAEAPFTSRFLALASTRSQGASDNVNCATWFRLQVSSFSLALATLGRVGLPWHHPEFRRNSAATETRSPE